MNKIIFNMTFDDMVISKYIINLQVVLRVERNGKPVDGYMSLTFNTPIDYMLWFDRNVSNSIRDTIPGIVKILSLMLIE